MSQINEIISHQIIESTDSATIVVQTGGPQGPPGTNGVDGAQGPAGSGGETVVFEQVIPINPWVITHTWPGGYPSITIVDTTNRVVVGDVNYDSDTQLTITFSGSFSGKAYLN